MTSVSPVATANAPLPLRPRPAARPFLLRLLTPGWGSPSSAATLRGWSRYLRWHFADSAEKRRLAKRAVWTPIRAWKEAGVVVATHGAAIEALSGVAPAVQRRQIWSIMVRHGLPAMSYVELLLYRPDRLARAAEFVHEDEFNHVMRCCRVVRPPMDGYPERDKPGFADWCRSHGFATVPISISYTADGSTPESRAAAAEALPACDLFSKPSDGDHGIGVELWRYDAATSRWTPSDGRPRTAIEVIEAIDELSRSLPKRRGSITRPMLIQRRARNHPTLAGLTSGALGTARFLTCRLPGRRVELSRVIYRMPVGDSVADKMVMGSVVAPVDLETGRIGAALQAQGDMLVPIDRHPDTGMEIAGTILPDYEQAVALAIAAHEAATGRPSMGWDVAFTDEGPLLIEGNTVSNPRIVQMPSGTPLGATVFPSAIDAHLRRVLWQE